MEGIRQIISDLIENEIFIEEEVISKLTPQIDSNDLIKFIHNSSDQSTLNLELLNSYLDQIKSQKEKKEQKEDSIKTEKAANELNDRKVHITWEYTENTEKKDFKQVLSYYQRRYEQIAKMLKVRSELKGVSNINRLSSKADMESVVIIGMVDSIGQTKNGHFMLEVEDLTGRIKVLVSTKMDEAFAEAEELCQDDIIGIVGAKGEDIIFANQIIHPDVPLTKELKKAPVEEYAAFISDIHVGSTAFLKDEFQKMTNFLKGEYGTDQHKEIASKVKYLFVTGDLVEGIGIYPNMLAHITHKTLKEQFDYFASFLEQLPKDITIIICPGNHDGVRIAEPQPKLYEDYAESLYALENVVMTTNPAIINIGRTKHFSGLDVLMYHGWSLIYYSNKVPSLIKAGGVENISHCMKYLIRRRHLGPFHESVQNIIEKDFDPLVITHVPDIFVTGHIHKTSIQNYRNVTLMCGSTWEDMTPYQEKFGLVPEPCRLPLVNLKTRKVRILKFGDVTRTDEGSADE